MLEYPTARGLQPLSLIVDHWILVLQYAWKKPSLENTAFDCGHVDVQVCHEQRQRVDVNPEVTALIMRWETRRPCTCTRQRWNCRTRRRIGLDVDGLENDGPVSNRSLRSHPILVHQRNFIGFWQQYEISNCTTRVIGLLSDATSAWYAKCVMSNSRGRRRRDEIRRYCESWH